MHAETQTLSFNNSPPRMRLRLLLLVLGVWVASLLVAHARTYELANNLSRVWFGGDKLSVSDWDAQAFNSGSSAYLLTVTINLYRTNEAAGTYWVKLYDQTGPDGKPGFTPVATLAVGQNIADLDTSFDNQVSFWVFGIRVVPHTTYFIVVGTDPDATGLAWGFTNDPLGAPGFPSDFSYTADGGSSWRAAWTPLPQRMHVQGFTLF